MLWVLAVVCTGLWIWGEYTGFTLGNSIHLLLVIAFIAAIIRLIRGKPFR